MHRFVAMNKKFVNFCFTYNIKQLFVRREQKSLHFSNYNGIQLNSLRHLSRFNDGIMLMSDEIKYALNQRQPILALESTIITHGMPFPLNIETAMNVEKIVRKSGVIPATIGVIEGKICVGMNEQQLQFLALENGTKDGKRKKVFKISRRDLPVILAKKLSGGTTVSATSLIAYRSGIDIFATGGIGGVHRGGESSFDISADLTELGRTPITIVSAGIKSILDIEKTLEVLETKGVCVVVFNGEEDIEGNVQFPAFFTRDSGCKIGYNVKTAEEAALMILKHKELYSETAILIAVPIPERDITLGEMVNNAISDALKEVKQNNIIGKEITPFVLKRVNEITNGRSLTANVALIENNARIASQIALLYSQLINSPAYASTQPLMRYNSTPELPNTEVECIQKSSQVTIESNNNQSLELSPVIIGGSIYDIVANANTHSLTSGLSRTQATLERLSSNSRAALKQLSSGSQATLERLSSNSRAALRRLSIGVES